MFEVAIFFQGAGTRSVNVLENTAHPGHGLYKNVKGCVKGASMACASVFQANVTTVPLLDEFQIPGIGGATSIAKYIKEGAIIPLPFNNMLRPDMCDKSITLQSLNALVHTDLDYRLNIEFL